MKTITKHIMTRYTWFLTWYKEWFKNAEGIKGFATQVMNWLMQSTMALAEKLKNQNKKLAEAIKATKANLAKRYEHPTVEADEWDEVKGTVRTLGRWIFVGILVETALNFFGISAVMLQQGINWVAFKVFIALLLTGAGIHIFKKWFAIALNKPKYKQVAAKPRNWIEFILLTFLCIAYESLIYYLCLIRGVALEGATGEGIFTYFVVLAGMLIPIIAGYWAYDRSLYLTPYRNTVRIAREEKEIARMERYIATNNQRMEDHFKRETERSVALLEEFKIYKINYNLKNGLKEEYITGHFCETHDSFEKEAVQRYQKEVLHQMPIRPTLVIAKEQMNGYSKQLANANINQ